MSRYNVLSGISTGTLYQNIGERSVVYTGNTYTTGQVFRGASGVTSFTFAGTGSTEVVNQVFQFLGTSIEYLDVDLPRFPENISFRGLDIEYLDTTIRFQEDIKFYGIGIELQDPSYVQVIRRKR